MLAVSAPSRFGSLRRDVLGNPFTQEGVHLLGLRWGCGEAGADRPDGLVGDDELLAEFGHACVEEVLHLLAADGLHGAADTLVLELTCDPASVEFQGRPRAPGTRAGCGKR
eukprot:COSAG05_NODE_305_length_11703_cov_15.056705_4_plen_111_part_00